MHLGRLIITAKSDTEVRAKQMTNVCFRLNTFLVITSEVLYFSAK